MYNIFKKYCKVEYVYLAYRRLIKQRQVIEHLTKQNAAKSLKYDAAVKYIGAKFLGKYIKYDGKVDRYLYVNSVKPFNSGLVFKDEPTKQYGDFGTIIIKSFDELYNVNIITKREHDGYIQHKQ